MKRRRGRRSFWWWSWLLLITAIGGTFGGAFLGKQQWEKADKDFPAYAVVKVDIRQPFQANGSKSAPTGIANVNEAQVMREIESHDGLSQIAADLDLTQKWALGLEEVIQSLRSSLDLDLNQEDSELNITVIRPDPAESAELANAIAKRVPEVIKNLDEFNKAEGLERLKLEAEPYIKTEQDAKDALKKALADMKVNLEIEPGIDLNIYMTVPAVAEAKEYWDTVRETKIAFEISQGEFERYWQKITKPSLVTTKATPAPYFTGPEVQPFQMQFGLYGLTLGLFVGILLMAVCWKLLP